MCARHRVQPSLPLIGSTPSTSTSSVTQRMNPSPRPQNRDSPLTSGFPNNVKASDEKSRSSKPIMGLFSRKDKHKDKDKDRDEVSLVGSTIGRSGLEDYQKERENEEEGVSFKNVFKRAYLTGRSHALSTYFLRPRANRLKQNRIG